MPNVHVSDSIFARFQSHAGPLVDTIADVIDGALAALETGGE